MTCKYWGYSHLHSVVFNPRHGTQQLWNTPQMFYPWNIYFIVIKIHYSTPFSVIVLFYDLLNCVEDSIKLRDHVMLILNTYLSYVSESTLTSIWLQVWLRGKPVTLHQVT